MDLSVESSQCNSTYFNTPVLGDRNVTSSSDLCNSSEEREVDIKTLEKELNIGSFDLTFDDLNEVVESLLKKSKGENGASKDIKRRQRKDPEQVKIMENEYQKNPNWTREFTKNLAKQLGLRESQVYKWHWDMRKKDGLELPKNGAKY